MNWLFALEIAGIAYVLWVFFVLALISSLKEIKKSSWHYNLNNLYGFSVPNNTCSYGGGLVLVPFLTAFLVIIFGVMWLLVIGFITPIRLLFHWVLLPVFVGRIPLGGLRKTYFIDLFNHDGLFPSCKLISTRPFMAFSPFLFILFIGVLGFSAHEWYRILSGVAGSTEIVVVLGGTLVSGLITGLIILFTRPSGKTMWAMLREKLCWVVPVTD